MGKFILNVIHRPEMVMSMLKKLPDMVRKRILEEQIY